MTHWPQFSVLQIPWSSGARFVRSIQPSEPCHRYDLCCPLGNVLSHQKTCAKGAYQHAWNKQEFCSIVVVCCDGCGSIVWSGPSLLRKQPVRPEPMLCSGSLILGPKTMLHRGLWSSCLLRQLPTPSLPICVHTRMNSCWYHKEQEHRWRFGSFLHIGLQNNTGRLQPPCGCLMRECSQPQNDSRRQKHIQYSPGAPFQTPALVPVPMGARFLSSTGLGLGTLIGEQNSLSTALDKSRSATFSYASLLSCVISKFCDWLSSYVKFDWIWSLGVSNTSIAPPNPPLVRVAGQCRPLSLTKLWASSSVWCMRGPTVTTWLKLDAKLAESCQSHCQFMLCMMLRLMLGQKAFFLGVPLAVPTQKDSNLLILLTSSLVSLLSVLEVRHLPWAARRALLLLDYLVGRLQRSFATLLGQEFQNRIPTYPPAPDWDPNQVLSRLEGKRFGRGLGREGLEGWMCLGWPCSTFKKPWF